MSSNQIDTYETNIRIAAVTIAFLIFFIGNLSTGQRLFIRENELSYLQSLNQSILTTVIAFYFDLSSFIIQIFPLIWLFIAPLVVTWKMHPVRVAGNDPLLIQVSELSKLIGLKKPPDVYITGFMNSNSFVYNFYMRHRLVLGKEILEILTPNELNAVILHELSHIRNRDAWFMTWSSTLVHFFKYLLLIVASSIISYRYLAGWWDFTSFVNWLPFFSGVFLSFFLIPLFLISSTSRVRELLADARTITHVDKFYLRDALIKCSRYEIKKKLFPHLLFIGEGDKQSKLFEYIYDNLFSTHPKLKDRLDAIDKLKYVNRKLKMHKKEKLEIYLLSSFSALYFSFFPTIGGYSPGGITLLQLLLSLLIPGFTLGVIASSFVSLEAKLTEYSKQSLIFAAFYLITEFVIIVIASLGRIFVTLPPLNSFIGVAIFFYFFVFMGCMVGISAAHGLIRSWHEIKFFLSNINS